MKKVHAVIGANFGDEGKGLITDYLAASYGGQALVVRHSGGAQAGHTVETVDDKRHVFCHVGSGALAGAPTFLSRFFICNPLWFARELARLKALGVKPLIYVDPQAAVTTPYEMMINQIAEEYRGNKRHGSCGIGIGETIERAENFLPLTAGGLSNIHQLRHTLEEIRKFWLPKRLAELGVKKIPAVWKKRIAANGILEHFMNECAQFCNATIPAPPGLLAKTPIIIFEGSQGLLLDQNRGFFPHVTRANTGIKNVAALAAEAGIEEIDVTYVTRYYATRHGAGPLPHELRGAPSLKIKDETNIYNPYQQHLRFAHLDWDLLAKSMFDDLSDAPAFLQIRRRLAVTCMDQAENVIHYRDGGEARRIASVGYLSALAKKLAWDDMLASFGPTRATVQPLPHLPMQKSLKITSSKSSTSTRPVMRPISAVA
ncbi:MAG: adenylosuccinate synthetase [Dongiaceae bacterium]